MTSLKDNPSALWRPALGTVKEWQDFSKEIRVSSAPLLKGVTDAGKVKNIINRQIIASLKEGDSPSARAIARALENQTGMSIEKIFTPEFKVRVPWGRGIAGSALKLISRSAAVAGVAAELYTPIAGAQEIDSADQRLGATVIGPLGDFTERILRRLTSDKPPELVPVAFGKSTEKFLFDPKKHGPASLYRIVSSLQEAADMHVEPGSMVKVGDFYNVGNRWQMSTNDGYMWIDNAYPGGSFALNVVKF
jgi:hypothetical protein